MVHLGIHLIYIGHLHKLINSVLRCLNWTHEFTMHISTLHYKLPPHRNLALESPCHSAVTSSTLYSQQGLTDRSMLFLPIRNISPFGSPSYCLPSITDLRGVETAPSILMCTLSTSYRLIQFTEIPDFSSKIRFSVF